LKLHILDLPFGEMLMRKLLILLACTAAVSVAACNTIAGAGKDVSATGNAVTDTAKDATPH
jgi:predicted small secreted protein